MVEKTTEFEKGFYDGLTGIQNKPTSLSYVEGYLRGQEVAKIGQTEKTKKSRKLKKGVKYGYHFTT